MSAQVQQGDKVSWNWNGNHPSGTVGEVKAGEVTVTSHRGNEISKTGDESNPAVHIERSGNDVVKTANELDIENKATGSSQQNGTAPDKVAEPKLQEIKEPEKPVEKQEEPPKVSEKLSEDKEGKKEDTEEPKAGEKRKADEEVDAEAEKKQKTTNGSATNGEKEEVKKDEGEKKKPGRPKGPNSKPKKEKKEPAVGQAQRRTRSQGAV